MKKKNLLDNNYLEKKPYRNGDINFSIDGEGNVTMEIENKGVFNRVFQLLLKKPKISYIHLEEIGSFVWPIIDGEKTITDVGVFVKEHFGEKAEPLYERLAKYFQILESYGFVKFN